jgi:hypothetical protein
MKQFIAQSGMSQLSVESPDGKLYRHPPPHNALVGKGVEKLSFSIR